MTMARRERLPDEGNRRVLITGAAGRIGRDLAARLADRFDLRLAVRWTDVDVDALRSLGQVTECELADLEGLKAACRGVDSVVHLAGNPDGGAAWADLLADNVVGTYHAFAAAKAEGVRRFVYASSIHAVSGYPADHQVHAGEPVNPGDLYGVTKCFGEALGRYMAEQEGLEVVCLRIGAYQPPEAVAGPGGMLFADDWVSPRDLAQLVVRSIEAEPLRFAIFHGLSGNRFNRLDVTDARDRLGYAPEDDAMRTNDALRGCGLPARFDPASGIAGGGQSGLRRDTAPGVGEAG